MGEVMPLRRHPAPIPPGAGALRLAGTYVGSVVGAGFASGQEHLRFFVSFGGRGLLGVLVAGAMLTLFGALFLGAARRAKTRSYRELLALLAPPPLCHLFDVLLLAFLFLSLAVMLAGSGAVFERLGAPRPSGALAMAVATFGIAARSPGSMLRANGLITAALVAFIFGIGVASAPRGWVHFFLSPAPIPAPSHGGWVPRSWLAAAALYGAYNLVLSLALFASLGGEIRDERASLWGGALGGATLTLLGLAVSLAVAAGGEAVSTAELPLEAALERMGSRARAAYVGVVWAAMLTTAVASAYALARRVKEWTRWRESAVCALLILGALPFASFGFSHLVATLYPLIGYAGSACILALALRHTRT